MHDVKKYRKYNQLVKYKGGACHRLSTAQAAVGPSAVCRRIGDTAPSTSRRNTNSISIFLNKHISEVLFNDQSTIHNIEICKHRFMRRPFIKIGTAETKKCKDLNWKTPEI
jgi:hypothetical protein